MKNMTLVIYFLKALSIVYYRKRWRKGKSQREEVIPERVKLRTEKADDEDSSDMSPLEGDEEIKEGKGLKIFTPNKLFTRLPMLLAEIKAGNNWYKLKNEVRQILYLLYQNNKTTKKVYNNLINLF